MKALRVDIDGIGKSNEAMVSATLTPLAANEAPPLVDFTTRIWRPPVDGKK